MYAAGATDYLLSNLRYFVVKMNSATLPVVVFATVLKSVLDVRMYQKLALSIENLATIHIIGVENETIANSITQNTDKTTKIYFHSTKKINRLSLQRLLFGFTFLGQIWRISPTILVINTPELLPFALVYKLFSKLFSAKKVRLVYDVMENYFQNIAYQPTYPQFIKLPLAFAVRGLEYFSSFFVNQFILAEQCYEKELEFIGNKYIIAENKFNPPSSPTVQKFQQNHFSTTPNFTSKKQLTFIHAGTISKTYGTKEAIIFIHTLYNYLKSLPATENIEVKLILIGYCSDHNYYTELQALSKNIAYIDWQISPDKPVPHDQIITALQTADIALLPYQINQSNQNRIPTKFYEYIYYQIPLVVSKNSFWESFCEPYACAITYPFAAISDTHSDIAIWWKSYVNTLFYTSSINKRHLTWNIDDKEKVIKAILG